MKAWKMVLPIAAFAVAAIAMFPLRMAWAATSPPAGLSVAAVDGTVWSGSLTGVTWNGVSLGDFETSVSPLEIMPQPAVRLDRGTGPLKSAVLRAGGDTLQLSESHIRVDLHRLSPRLPRDLIATITDGAIVLRAGACASASGRIAIPAAPAAPLPALTGTLSCAHGAIVARLTSDAGDVELVASGEDFAHVGWRGASPALAVALLATGLPQAKDT
jgi:hypothetical protein